MTGKEALQLIFPAFKKEPIICATGHLCRVAQFLADKPGNFYMIGSMGMASSIALGLSLSRPQQKIVALDGDGAALMNLGNMAMVGTLKPKNFIHLVIDNASYESTGGQQACSAAVKLENIAKASGYHYAKRVTTPSALKKELLFLLSKKGPSFLLVRVALETAPPPPRIRWEPQQITERFMESLR